MSTIDITTLVRKNILTMVPYSSARDEFKGDEAVFLDANENPYGTLNRYPDPYQTQLKEKLAAAKNVSAKNIFIGNGSDEVIDLAIRIFCNPQKDKILICPPTYGMYEVAAAINDIEVVEVPLTDSFSLDVEAIISKANTEKVKMIFICSPNNPTGNSLENIETILEQFKGIVFIDEAYIDFSEKTSFNVKINSYPNLIVSQTFSKAWGMAAARVGMAFADEKIISLCNKVKPPYNVSEPNQQVVLKALERPEVFKQNLKAILVEKERMIKELYGLKSITTIYPSDANFILVEIANATSVYNSLVQKKVITRDRSKVVADTIRITIGTPTENDILLNELKNVK